MFADTLLEWFDAHKRELPWRGESDPYKIWISEIILQQTRVVQGISYYHNFIASFPDVTALALADEAEVLKVWQGLGYYSRARNLHAAAKSILAEHDGVFPSDYASIRRLKGVGDYTAAAIGSIAFRLPYAAVDGNVLRFVARYQGVFENIANDATRKHITEICNRWLPAARPGDFNQAMMEMGATLCTPKSPDCENCPFSVGCHAYRYGQVEQLPIKEQVVKIQNRYFHYIIFLYRGKTLLQQRTGNDIWKNLYEFPLVETKDENFDFESYLKENKMVAKSAPQLLWQTKHVLSHRNIFAYFHIVETQKPPKFSAAAFPVKLSELKNYAVAKVTERAIEKAESFSN